jgi:hypothetical protein
MRVYRVADGAAEPPDADATTDAQRQCSGVTRSRMRMSHDLPDRYAMLMTPEQVRDLSIQVIWKP